MNTISLPKFNQLQRLLDKTTLEWHASQAHGLMCGLLCGVQKKTQLWEELILGAKKSKKVHDLLQILYAASMRQLADFDFEFEMLLPQDEASLPVRAEALVVWVQGFLTGLKSVNIQIVGRDPSEMTEAINDLIEIAKMDYEQVLENEEDEVSYVELVEFIRMAVVLIYQEMHDTKSIVQPKSSRLH